jgi:hypothetical protein
MSPKSHVKHPWNALRQKTIIRNYIDLRKDTVAIIRKKRPPKSVANTRNRIFKAVVNRFRRQILICIKN